MLCWVVATIVILYGVIKSLSFESDCKFSGIAQCKGKGEIVFIEYVSYRVVSSTCSRWLPFTAF